MVGTLYRLLWLICTRRSDFEEKQMFGFAMFMVRGNMFLDLGIIVALIAKTF